MFNPIKNFLLKKNSKTKYKNKPNIYTISCPDFQKNTLINHHTNIKQKNKSNKVTNKNTLNKDQKSKLYFLNHTLDTTDLDKTKTNNTNNNEPTISKLLITVNSVVTLLWNPYLLMLVKAIAIDDSKNKIHPKTQTHFSFFIYLDYHKI